MGQRGRLLTTFRASKVIALLGALGMSAGLVACSSGDGPDEGRTGERGQHSAVPGVSDDFDRRNMVVTAVCSPGNPNASIDVDGWDPQNWQHLAHAEFRLPATAVTTEEPSDRRTAVRKLCELEDDRVPAATAEIRALFDQHFTKIAVVTYDPETKASHVGYVDRSGTFVDVTGTEDFGVTPKEEDAVFAWDGGSIWFTYQARATIPHPASTVETRIASRAVTGDRKLVDHWRGYTPPHSLVTLGESGKVAMGQGIRNAPDGRHLIVEGRLLETPADTNVIAHDGTVDPVDPGRLLPCGGTGWIDNDTVLCGGGRFGSDHRLVTVDITPGAQPGAAILPENDRANYPMAVSPDGRQFVFVAAQRTSKEYYLSATTPGSTPVKIERSGPFSALGDNAAFVEWR